MEQKESTSFAKTFLLRTVWFARTPCRLLAHLVQLLRKFFSWAPLAILVGPPTDQGSLDRPIRHAKKRLETVARVIFAFSPLRFHPTVMEQDLVPKETLEAPIHPLGKGNKRKQDEVTQEEEDLWAEFLHGELPDEDDPEDPTYEATNPETDSEEYNSQNDTDVNLEVEEKDGIFMLKEDQPEQATNPETDSEEYNSQNDTDVNLEVEEKDGIFMLKEDPPEQDV